MKLYLVRHGEAVFSEIDQEQSLSPSGISSVKEIAKFLKTHPIVCDVVYHSVKKRAKETAHILLPSLGINVRCEEREGLKPNDPILPLADELLSEREHVMIVGHLPFLSKLASKLILADEGRPIVSFGPSTLVCLSNDEGFYQIKWALSPEFFIPCAIR